MPRSKSSIKLPDRFKVSSHVADGGMASVWAAEDRTLRRMVAIKLLSLGLLGDESAAARFQREARAAARLSNHPHVVTIFDVGEHEGQPFIVMEYMSGGSLADVIRNGRPDRKEALEWLRHAGEALDMAHERDIVHRDVKPGNLLLDERRHLGVTDFGIASVAYDTSVTRTGEVMGTAAYISPEQAAGDAAGAASDRYALAVVAYELLTGVRPFAGGSFAAQARQHLEEEPEPPSLKAQGDLPAAVDPVLLRGLSKDPDRRWASGAEMAAELEAALADEIPTKPTAAMAPTEATRAMTPRAPAPIAAPARARPSRPAVRRPSTPARPRRDNRPPWFAAVAVAAAALVGVVVLAALLGGGDEPASTQSERPATTTTSTPTASTPAPATQAQTTPQPATDGRSISQLDAAGYGLSQQGRYEEAVPLERAAVRQCGDSTETQCAYALFNLGTALNRAGQAEEAIPYLERRLEISNDRPSIVQAELDRARAAAGQGNGNGEGGNGNGRGNGQGGGGGGDGD